MIHQYLSISSICVFYRLERCTRATYSHTSVRTLLYKETHCGRHQYSRNASPHRDIQVTTHTHQREWHMGQSPPGLPVGVMAPANPGKHGRGRCNGVKHRQHHQCDRFNKSPFWHHDATCCLLHHRPHERTRGPPTVYEPRPRSSVLVREVVGPQDGVQE